MDMKTYPSKWYWRARAYLRYENWTGREAGYEHALLSRLAKLIDAATARRSLGAW
jgi:hypothetical protein